MSTEEFALEKHVRAGSLGLVTLVPCQGYDKGLKVRFGFVPIIKEKQG